MKTVTTIVMTVMALASANVAKADGFLCEAQNTGLKIKLYNNTNPNIGTRVPAIMVISDPTIASPNKTIAVFKDVNRTLSYEGYGQWSAKVDLRFNDSGRAGENIAGTKLGRLKHIDLMIEFDYAHTDKATLAYYQGSGIKGKIDYVKRDGEILTEKVECTRYLKN